MAESEGRILLVEIICMFVDLGFQVFHYAAKRNRPRTRRNRTGTGSDEKKIFHEEIYVSCEVQIFVIYTVGNQQV